MSLGQFGARALAALAALVLAGACTDDTQFRNLCQEDSECPAGRKCIEGQCLCADDAACASNEFCNPSGSCQARVGCETSLDCPQGQYCDRTTGRCLDRDKCTEDVQCPLGKICDQLRFSCVDGCRDVGDCELGAVCECPDNTSCSLKQCKVGPCGDNSYCKYGESCIAETEGGPKRCVKDERGPFCDPCTIGPGQDYCPGESANFCLVDTSKNFGSYFCGVECAVDDECPWGFGCHDVLILTEQTCGGGGEAGQCPLRGNIECTQDSDCPGGTCDTAAGKCRALCVGGESDVQGFCTCMQDSDCPGDTCDTFDHRCSISRKPCDPNQPNPCGTIFCKHVTDPQTQVKLGYCFIGRNCAPVEGVTCDQVRSQR